MIARANGWRLHIKRRAVGGQVLQYVEDVLAERVEGNKAAGRSLLELAHSLPSLAADSFADAFASSVKDLLMVCAPSSLFSDRHLCSPHSAFESMLFYLTFTQLTWKKTLEYIHSHTLYFIIFIHISNCYQNITSNEFESYL